MSHAADHHAAISVPAGETHVLKHFQARTLTGWSCRMFREKKNSDAPAVKREAEEE